MVTPNSDPACLELKNAVTEYIAYAREYNPSLKTANPDQYVPLSNEYKTWSQENLVTLATTRDSAYIFEDLLKMAIKAPAQKPADGKLTEVQQCAVDALNAVMPAIQIDDPAHKGQKKQMDCYDFRNMIIDIAQKNMPAFIDAKHQKISHDGDISYTALKQLNLKKINAAELRTMARSTSPNTILDFNSFVNLARVSNRAGMVNPNALEPGCIENRKKLMEFTDHKNFEDFYNEIISAYNQYNANNIEYSIKVVKAAEEVKRQNTTRPQEAKGGADGGSLDMDENLFMGATSPKKPIFDQQEALKLLDQGVKLDSEHSLKLANVSSAFKKTGIQLSA